MLVLDDLSHLEQGDCLGRAGTERARSLARCLADLHGRWWDDPRADLPSEGWEEMLIAVLIVLFVTWTCGIAHWEPATPREAQILDVGVDRALTAVRSTNLRSWNVFTVMSRPSPWTWPPQRRSRSNGPARSCVGHGGDLGSLIATASDGELDWDDPERRLPEWATWRTLQQMAWHVVDTESRYYLATLGMAPPQRAPALDDELRRSHRHVISWLSDPQPERCASRDGQVWTTRKVLRRLAWHERSELDAMRAIRDRARTALLDG